ncbi:hypothetical protein SAMN05216316_0655 [Nitrosovibrio sp. Nv6]|nr:hypothetical protein SAMN05216316_0655 [Nitrosovibrio sp. Nv6]
MFELSCYPIYYKADLFNRRIISITKSNSPFIQSTCHPINTRILQTSD